MALPQPNPPTRLATYDWALHLDASLFAQHLRGFAERAGVTRIDARVEDVELAEGGRIAAIRRDEGRWEEGRGGKECGRRCRTRGLPVSYQKKKERHYKRTENRR